MKRYLLFEGAEYYPGGGWDDFTGDFDTVEEARATAKGRTTRADWWQIIDTKTMEEIPHANPHPTPE